MILREDWIRVELEEKSATSLVIPETAKQTVNEETAIFEVREVGLLCQDVRVGDKVVLFGLGSLARFEYVGVKLFVSRERDVICILNREPEQGGRNAGDRPEQQETGTS